MATTSRIARIRRRTRIRRRVQGTTVRPRLSVYRSGRHMYAQVIIDGDGRTVLATSTLAKELRTDVQKPGTVDAAKQVGLNVAKHCLEHGIREVVFDRNGFLYHGRVRAVADGAREGGLKF